MSVGLKLPKNFTKDHPLDTTITICDLSGKNVPNA